MNKSVNAGRAINLILTNEDINIDSKSQLIQVKKFLEFGESNFGDVLKKTKINTFYRNYLEKISIWLQQPIDLVAKRIAQEDLNEIESMLVLTNILIENNKSEEQKYDFLY
ncbi:MAG: hypothetical protein RR598_11090 [Anaerorhabdus sp.]